MIKDHANAMDFKHPCGFQGMSNAQEHCGFEVSAMDLSNEHMMNLADMIATATSFIYELRIKQFS